MNRKLEAKAARLILEGRVEIENVTFADDGQIDEALGWVKGDSGKTWMVHIDGDETTCSCPYGTVREYAHGHSHDIAVRVAATATRSKPGNYTMREEG